MTRLIPFDGVYYCPWTGMAFCTDENGKCPEWEDCPIRIEQEKDRAE